MSSLSLRVTWLVKIYRTSRHIRQSDGTTSIYTNPCSPFFVMCRRLCPKLWDCSLQMLSFKLSHCGSGYFSNQIRLAKLIVQPKVLIIWAIARQNSATTHESLNGLLSIESLGRPSDQKLPFHTLFGVPLTQALKTSPTISAPSSYP
jgi:hypothetical protein